MRSVSARSTKTSTPLGSALTRYYNLIDPYSKEDAPYAVRRDSVWEADQEHAEFILGLLASNPPPPTLY